MPIAEQHELSASPYPTRVEKVSYGHALVASRNLEAGTIVEKFVGPDVMYETLSDVDKTYVLNYQPMGCSEWKWYGLFGFDGSDVSLRLGSSRNRMHATRTTRVIQTASSQMTSTSKPSSQLRRGNKSPLCIMWAPMRIGGILFGALNVNVGLAHVKE
ncbi:hypothetical protein SeLEV6574_g00688 [Synchytrium endobioticum]|uniref:Uncharacterized protein n=1 Tax=Synchytrium endobioticum TaxID=286115 RepID=A0A507DGM5_9FUNG|nr:hypothetical protein SeLEV6574_g00688 [Synchytrium endobioticum]